MKRLIAAAVLALAGSAAAEEGRPLKMEIIDQVIERVDRSVQSCGSRGSRNTQAVLLRLEIDADGRVVSAAPISDKMSAATNCLARVARRIKFPATGVTTQIEYPFMLLRR